MVENTRLKELATEITRLKDLLAEVCRITEVMERREPELQKWMEHLTLREQDAENRFQTLESTLGSLLQTETPPSTEPPPFQVRNVKLDFPRFDGTDMQNRANVFPTWVAFTRALETEFGPSPYECPSATLFKLTQTSSVHDYYT
ncbi:hypothetical protein V8G54_033438 [Vigna mungo]|uniref:Uncharacterized protein n=1 Tax=Vigna mungo TaxID=3915 RepID=A0AAQ3MNY6_VIGMU